MQTLVRIAALTEDEALARVPPLGRSFTAPEQAIAAAAAEVGRTVAARALAVFTQTGTTARWLASHRSPLPVLAFTSQRAVRSTLAFTWGVETFVTPAAYHTDEAVAQVDRTLLGLGRAAPGERVVVVAGRPGRSGSTNTVLVHELASR